MIGNMIRYYRTQNKMTQAKLGKLLGISQQTLAHYENGYAEPNLDIIRKLCSIFNVSADELLEIESLEIKKE